MTKSKYIILGLVLIGLIFYIVGINFYAENEISKTETCEGDECLVVIGDDGGFVEKVGVSESVDVTVRRNRWYGTIIENKFSNGKNLDNLYVFTKLKIPLNVNGQSLISWHIVAISTALIIGFIVVMISIIILIIEKEVNENERMD